MKRPIRAALLSALLAAGCSPRLIAPPPVTPFFTATVSPAALTTAIPMAAATLPASPTPSPSAVPSLVPTFAPTPGPTCGEGWCATPGHFLLSRPVASPYGDQVDPTYRYASTDNGAHQPHTGVEFQAPEGQAVMAAGDGQVVQAGPDLAPRFAGLGDEYGNLIILQHSFAAYPEPVYTLYGHLSQVEVQPGQTVKAGQEIGKVGDTGIATGPHLHFEVRVGNDPLPQTRNPELWLQPILGAAQPVGGAIAGRVTQTDASPLLSQTVVLQRQPDAGSPHPLPVYLKTYDTAALPTDDAWNENFAAGDLPPGLYRISVMAGGRMNTREITIFSGQVTLVSFGQG